MGNSLGGAKLTFNINEVFYNSTVRAIGIASLKYNLLSGGNT